MSKLGIQPWMLGIVGVVIICWLIGVMMSASYDNREVGLREQIVAQQRANQAVFDEVWKVIQQQAGVADQYSDKFRAIYADIMNARYAGKDPLLQFITESNPSFDISLYQQLSSTIEAKRASFRREQEKLIDLRREHSTLLKSFPSRYFLAGRKEIDITIVTSAKTEEAFKTGQENDIDLFKKE